MGFWKNKNPGEELILNPKKVGYEVFQFFFSLDSLGESESIFFVVKPVYLDAIDLFCITGDKGIIPFFLKRFF